ncbi:MAG: AAA family ATPase [Lachnospiraceae bacterium]|nr:AAA family ATPase [Lachnospiraceae bacterium]
MIILITGASHTGKTVLAQKLLERYQFPYVSIDHIKMGLIRSGQTNLTPEDDEELVSYLWPIVREMIKTAIENHQHLILEGCYIPFDWKKDFEEEYLKEITYICLIMTEQYIREHFSDIQFYASEIEQRLDDSDCTMEWLLKENQYNLEMSKKYSLPYHFIEKDYTADIDRLLRHSFSECF